MKATIKQAENNDRNLTISLSGYGHWKISCDYRNKRISTVTTNSEAVDSFKAQFGEKTIDGYNRRLAGYITLCEEIIYNNTI